MAAWPTVVSGPSSTTECPTESASTPKKPSGTPTCRTSAASAYAKAATSSTQSTSTAAASPARSAAPTDRSSTSSRPNGTVRKTCSKAKEPESYSRSQCPPQRRVGQADNDLQLGNPSGELPDRGPDPRKTTDRGEMMIHTEVPPS